MKKVEIEIQLIIRFYDSFFFAGGTGNGKIQSYLMRDISGFPYVSGAALKGCIAKYAAALAKLIPALDNGETLFGVGGVQQGNMYFENGKLIGEGDYHGLQGSLMETRTGVSISRYTKAKKEGHLYTIELGGLAGKMAFQSSIHGFMEEETCQRDIAHLVAAIRLIYSLGGKRSSGLGWLQEPIECHVIKGSLSKRELVGETEVNQWIDDWIGGKKCTK